MRTPARSAAIRSGPIPSRPGPAPRGRAPRPGREPSGPRAQAPGRSLGERQQQVGQVALGVDGEHRDAGGQHLLHRGWPDRSCLTRSCRTITPWVVRSSGSRRTCRRRCGRRRRKRRTDVQADRRRRCRRVTDADGAERSSVASAGMDRACHPQAGHRRARAGVRSFRRWRGGNHDPDGTAAACQFADHPGVLAVAVVAVLPAVGVGVAKVMADRSATSATEDRAAEIGRLPGRGHPGRTPGVQRRGAA